MWLLPIKVRAERSHLVLLPWRAGGILTPCLPNYIRLSFHYALAPVSDLSHLLCWTGQVMFVFWILRFLFVCFLFIFISWRLITLQYCSDFCHTLKWISHGFTCVPHPNPPSYLPTHFKAALSLSSLTFIKRFFSSSSLSAIRVVSSA